MQALNHGLIFKKFQRMIEFYQIVQLKPYVDLNTKPKYCDNANPCYMNADTSIVHVNTNDIYKDIAEDIETRFDTSNFEIDKSLPKK